MQPAHFNCFVAASKYGDAGLLVCQQKRLCPTTFSKVFAVRGFELTRVRLVDGVERALDVS